MDYFIIEQHKECIKQLNKKADIVGVNWRGLGTGIRLARNHANHFSGNYWWAKTNYIAQLGLVNKGNHGRCEAEFWIGKGAGDATCLFESNINHYTQPYLKENYKEKIEITKYKFDRGVSRSV